MENVMPTIRASADLRNKYLDISNYCHSTNEPVFITKNGQGDLAVMIIECYDNLMAKIDLYSQLAEGIKEIEDGRAESFDTAISDLRKKLGV